MDPADTANTFWLEYTNIALGLVTVVLVLAVVAGVVRELWYRLACRKEKLADDHAFHTPGLGVTMADGGERIDRR